MAQIWLPAVLATIRKPKRRIYCYIAGLTLMLPFSSFAMAARIRDCPAEIGSKTVRNLHGFVVEFTAIKDADSVSEAGCEVVVRDSAQKVIFSEEDSDFSLAISDADLAGDGVPDLVLESYSGGAHCCWTYYILSMGVDPHLVKQFDNERGAGFVRNENTGRVDIVTQDGAFDYFDSQCHACTEFPVVYLRLEGDQWVDSGPDHIQDYDEIIAKSRQALTAEEIQSFRSAQGDPYEADDSAGTTSKKILSIVFAYLYSGRPEQAQQALQELWPPSDQSRLWNLILVTRHKGILSQTGNARH